MKKKVKSKLILLFAGLSSLLLLGGCSLGESFDEVIENRDLTAQVTYYSNGGAFEGNPSKKDMYYPTGAQALNIGKVNPNSGTVEIKRNNYNFLGWYHAVLDKEGNPVYEDEENGVLMLGEPVDFSIPLQEGDHWTLVASWEAKVQLKIQLVCDEGKEIPVEGDEEGETLKYKNGDIVTTYSYGTLGEVDLDSVEPFTAMDKSFTFVEYYYDADCTQLVEESLVQGTEDVTVYAKYVEGDWTIVKTASDVVKMFGSVTQGKRYWLIRDIDAKGKEIGSKATFGCEIQGNGYTISNLIFGESRIKGNSKVSIFGKIEKTAVLQNITFDGLTIEYDLFGSPSEIYFAFTSIAEGAKIDNVSLKGNMVVDKLETEILTNFIEGFDNCLFGGFAKDADYLTASENKGFTVNDGADPKTFITINSK